MILCNRNALNVVKDDLIAKVDELTRYIHNTSHHLIFKVVMVMDLFGWNMWNVLLLLEFYDFAEYKQEKFIQWQLFLMQTMCSVCCSSYVLVCFVSWYPERGIHWRSLAVTWLFSTFMLYAFIQTISICHPKLGLHSLRLALKLFLHICRQLAGLLFHSGMGTSIAVSFFVCLSVCLSVCPREYL